MPEYTLLLSPPVSGERNFYPVVQISQFSSRSGGWISVTPIAVIIEEEGIWSFIALEDGITDEIIGKIRHRDMRI